MLRRTDGRHPDCRHQCRGQLQRLHHPDGRKTGLWAVHALHEFRLRFPDTIQKFYTDNGTEFVNSKVLGWCEEAGIKHRTTKLAHAWSNGKAERTQAVLKREVIIPALVERRFRL